MSIRGKVREVVTIESVTMVALQQGKFGIKPDNLSPEESDMHATAQHVLLNTVLFLSNIVPFVEILKGSTFLL